MTERTLAALMAALYNSQHELRALLSELAPAQDWRPAAQEWSFRFIAAHLAATDEECFWERVTRIVAEEKPAFGYYLNTGRDFSRQELGESLHAWGRTRQRLLDFVAGLPEQTLERTGVHQICGEVSMIAVLQSMLDHDREHLAELESLRDRYRGEQAP